MIMILFQYKDMLFYCRLFVLLYLIFVVHLH